MHKYIQLPGDLTGQQAWALMEFIYQIEEIIWDTYEDKLLPLVVPDPPDTTESDLLSDLDYDDIPF